MASGEMTDEAFRAFLMQTLGAAAQVSRDSAVHFICMDWRHMDDLSVVGRSVYGELLNLCVWNKSNAGMGSLYRSKHELVFVYKVGSAPHFNAVELGRHGRNRTNVWDYASVNSLAGSRREDLELHPTVKPTALVADAIQDVTRRGELVLDTFLGSGTTLIASERCGRRFRGLDIDPAYVDVALERWSAMTGGTPELAERGDGGVSGIGPGRPPAASRFRKGESGNPKGRPKSRSGPAPSAFDVVIDRTLTVTQNGTPREVTVEEALQHRTYQDAIAGSRAARREVLKWIAKREQWLAAHAPKRRPSIEVLAEDVDPANAHEALLLLGIAEPDTRFYGLEDKYERLLLQPWAVQAALSRPGRRRLSARDISEIKRCTRDAETLRWPAGVRDEQDD